MSKLQNSSLSLAKDEACGIKLELLNAGFIRLRMNMFVQDASADLRPLCPTMSWLLTHPGYVHKRLIFDLGLRKDRTGYPPKVAQRLQGLVEVETTTDVIDSLTAGGLRNADIDTIILSHLHYDHIGDPSRFPEPTRFIVGPGSETLLSGSKTYPDDPDSHFSSTLLPRDRTTILPDLPTAADMDSAWRPLGPFPHALDYFGDGSMYIISSPGHLFGHINLLVRVSSKPSKWVYLAGDSAHSPDLLYGTGRVAVYVDDETGCLKCAHLDKDAAAQHIANIKILMAEMGEELEVVLSHDWDWFERESAKWVLPGVVFGSKAG